MKFFIVAFAIATSAVMVTAAPTSGSQLEPRVDSLPGTCNGTRCNSWGAFYDCYRGTSCTKQSGAGDGQRCHVSTSTDLAKCPGNGNYDGPTS